MTNTTTIPTVTREIATWRFSADCRTREDVTVTRTFRPVQFAGQPTTHIGAEGEGWSGSVLCGTFRRRYPVAAVGRVNCEKCLKKEPEIAAELNASA